MARGIATINEETKSIEIDPSFLPASLRSRAEELAAYLNEALGDVHTPTRQLQRKVERLALNWCERMRNSVTLLHIAKDGVELDPQDFPNLPAEGLLRLATDLNFRFEKAANGQVSPTMLQQMQAFVEAWLTDHAQEYKKEDVA